MLSDEENEIVLLNFDIMINRKAMQLHLSQFVWFGKPFVFFRDILSLTLSGNIPFK